MAAEIPLRIGWPAGTRVGVNLIEQRRAVREIEKSRERIEWPRTADQIVVVLLSSVFTAKRKSVITADVAQRVTKFIRIFRKDARGCFGPVRSPTNAVKG